MTPLIHSLVRNSQLPIKRRQPFDDKGRVGPKLLGAHCFEVTAALELAHEMGQRIVDTGSSRRLGFLPAPLTILECFSNKFGEREALLLEDGETQDENIKVTAVHWDCHERLFYTLEPHSVPIFKTANPFPKTSSADRKRYLAGLGWDSDERILAMLAVINTPRVINRRQHMPHAGLERELARQRGMVGRFPLQAWTEIILEIRPQPRDAGTEGLHEAHYTGQRALHFCRRHLRISNGQLVMVKPHWRGDPALGIKQSRYALKMPSRPLAGAGSTQGLPQLP